MKGKTIKLENKRISSEHQGRKDFLKKKRQKKKNNNKKHQS